MNLLSVDWDFFFPEGALDPRTDQDWDLWDWGHREARFFIDNIWPVRAEGFLRRGLPLPQLSGEEQGFWGRFRFGPDCRLLHAESHACATLPVVAFSITHVFSFDAHHDFGYGTLANALTALTKGIGHCDNWLLYYALSRRRTRVLYPRWKTWAFDTEEAPSAALDRRFDDGKRFRPVIHRVFACRSGAWVPPWCDDAYQAFLDSCPVTSKKAVGETVARSFDLEAVRQRMHCTQEAIKHLEGDVGDHTRSR